MTNQELLVRLESAQHWTNNGIAKLRELTENENRFTEAAIQELKSEALSSVQLNISEMEILSLELGGM